MFTGVVALVAVCFGGMRSVDKKKQGRSPDASERHGGFHEENGEQPRVINDSLVTRGFP
jgi:hypothetical protein